MDPDANLDEQRRLAEEFAIATDRGEPIDEDDVIRLAALVVSLDRWLLNGGFLPKRWAR